MFMFTQGQWYVFTNFMFLNSLFLACKYAIWIYINYIPQLSLVFNSLYIALYIHFLYFIYIPCVSKIMCVLCL